MAMAVYTDQVSAAATSTETVAAETYRSTSITESQFWLHACRPGNYNPEHLGYAKEEAYLGQTGQVDRAASGCDNVTADFF